MIQGYCRTLGAGAAGVAATWPIVCWVWLVLVVCWFNIIPEMISEGVKFKYSLGCPQTYLAGALHMLIYFNKSVHSWLQQCLLHSSFPPPDQLKIASYRPALHLHEYNMTRFLYHQGKIWIELESYSHGILYHFHHWARLGLYDLLTYMNVHACRSVYYEENCLGMWVPRNCGIKWNGVELWGMVKLPAKWI